MNNTSSQVALNVFVHGLYFWGKQGVEVACRRRGPREEINGAVVGLMGKQGYRLGLVGDCFLNPVVRKNTREVWKN